MAYGIAVSGVKNFEVTGNTLTTSATFVGIAAGNCSTSTATPAPFIYQSSTVDSSTLQPDFVNVQDAGALTCIQAPPTGNSSWPFASSSDVDIAAPGVQSDSSDSASLSPSAAVAIGVVAAIAAAGLAAFFIRRSVLRRKGADKESNRMSDAYGGYIRYD